MFSKINIKPGPKQLYGGQITLQNSLTFYMMGNFQIEDPKTGGPNRNRMQCHSARMICPLLKYQKEEHTFL